MPRRKKGWSKVSTWTVIVLGLVASVTINLVTAWLQKDVISNALYLFLVFFLLAAIMYSARKMRTPPLLNNVFWFLVASVSFNLFSTWIQMSVLHDTCCAATKRKKEHCEETASPTKKKEAINTSSIG